MVEDWIANHRAQHSGRKGTEDDPDLPLAGVVRGEVAVDDGDDNGVIDIWSLSLTGCPLEPVPDVDGSWRVPSVLPEWVPITARVSRRQRAYWRSKVRGHELLPPEA